MRGLLRPNQSYADCFDGRLGTAGKVCKRAKNFATAQHAQRRRWKPADLFEIRRMERVMREFCG